VLCRGIVLLLLFLLLVLVVWRCARDPVLGVLLPDAWVLVGCGCGRGVWVVDWRWGLGCLVCHCCFCEIFNLGFTIIRESGLLVAVRRKEGEAEEDGRMEGSTVAGQLYFLFYFFLSVGMRLSL